MPKFAISDIHGCVKTFQTLLQKINFSPADELYLLGDYIDRGSDSKGVIDLIWTYQESGYQVHCLLGNHEQMLLDAVKGELGAEQVWLRNGGKETLQSFGVSKATQLPQDYVNFFKNCHFYLEVEDYILVHAGINFFHFEPLEEKHSLLWARNWYQYIDFEWLKNRVIIHGHTPTHQNDIENLLKNIAQVQVLNIDAGCVYVKQRADLGQLCAFDMTNQKLVFQAYVD